MRYFPASGAPRGSFGRASCHLYAPPLRPGRRLPGPGVFLVVVAAPEEASLPTDPAWRWAQLLPQLVFSLLPPLVFFFAAQLGAVGYPPPVPR